MLPCDEASDPAEDASDPGEGLTNQVAGRSGDSTATYSGLRWSDRRSRPPVRLSYQELGNPVAKESRMKSMDGGDGFKKQSLGYTSTTLTCLHTSSKRRIIVGGDISSASSFCHTRA